MVAAGRRARRPEVATTLMAIIRASSNPAASSTTGYPDCADLPGTAENIQVVVGEPTPKPPATRTRPSVRTVAVWRQRSIAKPVETHGPAFFGSKICESALLA